ncbi:MAG: amino acid transport protein [Acidobacteria bacterium]|nr:amino acid transport protein [Acidobacteriota bacterium]
MSLIPAGIGFVLFTYGRKQERYAHLAAGVAFMAYPYFTPNAVSLIAVGAAIAGGLWLALRAGW